MSNAWNLDQYAGRAGWRRRLLSLLVVAIALTGGVLMWIAMGARVPTIMEAAFLALFVPVSLFIGSVKAFLVAAAVFVPFERLSSLRPTQAAFRDGWAMDVLTGFMNGVLLYVALQVVAQGVLGSALAGNKVPLAATAGAIVPFFNGALLLTASISLLAFLTHVAGELSRLAVALSMFLGLVGVATFRYAARRVLSTLGLSS